MNRLTWLSFCFALKGAAMIAGAPTTMAADLGFLVLFLAMCAGFVTWKEKP